MTSFVGQPRQLTLEEFFAADFPGDGAKREWIGGRLVSTPGRSPRHDALQTLLSEWFAFFQMHRPQYSAYLSPLLRLDETHLLVPDFVIVRSAEHGGPCRASFVWLEGRPDVVVEVLSEGSVWRDLAEKRREYEQGCVPEYWVLDPAEGRALFLRLQEGRYREVDVQHGEQYACAVVPGLRLDLGALFRSDLAAAVRALGLEPLPQSQPFRRRV